MTLTLLEVVHGSHIWGMNNENSDIDIFRCYLARNNDLLLGKQQHSSEDKRLMPAMNVQNHELGTVVEQILKNNFNYFLAVFSPIVCFSNYRVLESLRNMATFAMSKEIYNSTHGMAAQNYMKYVVSATDVSQKRLNTICRNLQFGITLLKYGKVEFAPFTEGSADKIKELLSELDCEKEKSKLPDRASDEVARRARQYLLFIRRRYGDYYE